MIKIITTLIAVFALFGCCNNVCYYLDEKENLCNKIIRKTATELKNELKLVPYGSGGQAMDQVKMLALCFIYREPVEIDQARTLLIASVDKFTAKINENEDIRRYLNNYPFETKNVEILIYIQDPSRNNFEPEKLCVVSIISDILEYQIHDPSTKKLTTIYKETYEDAVRNLKKQSNLKTDTSE